MGIIARKASKASYLDLPAITDRSPIRALKIALYADLMTIKKTTQNLTEMPPVQKTRGQITDYSNKSRNRMLRVLGKVRNPGTMFFITPTYPDEIWFSEGGIRRLQTDLENLCKRIERLFPLSGIIWRKEWKIRQSGEHTGQIAPHLHLIVKSFTMSKDDAKSWFFKNWAEIIGVPDGFSKPLQCDVRFADSRRHAFYYLSKYTAKVNSEDESLISEFFHNHSGDIGRHWGIRGCWDLSASVEIGLSIEEAINLKRIIRSWLKSKDDRRKKYGKRLSKVKSDHGFSVFGLGDGEKPPGESLILKMCGLAISLAK